MLALAEPPTVEAEAVFSLRRSRVRSLNQYSRPTGAWSRISWTTPWTAG